MNATRIRIRKYFGQWWVILPAIGEPVIVKCPAFPDAVAHVKRLLEEAKSKA